METIKTIFKIGIGPSSSHTMGPKKAAEIIRKKYAGEGKINVGLYSSLAATGKGHLSDYAIKKALNERLGKINWKPDEELPYHPNGMRFTIFDKKGKVITAEDYYSIGGGKISTGKGKTADPEVYKLNTMTEIVDNCRRTGKSLWELVKDNENKDIEDYLEEVLNTMFSAIENGFSTEGLLPGGLGLSRKALSFKRKLQLYNHFSDSGEIMAYALAVAEENASGGKIVTAPTCGSCGVLPAVLKYASEKFNLNKNSLIHALMTAGLIGNVIRKNASISGAEVGCQGEIGTACSMASAAMTQILGGGIKQIEYSAEMGLEHHLGLTCDPVKGLVQIPCIERNAHGAARALISAQFAMLTEGEHRIPFDHIVKVMKVTGHDLPNLYRETALGGLAKEEAESSKS